MTYEEFDIAFKEFKLAFNRPPDEEQTKAYFVFLQYYDAREVGEVLTAAITEDEYFPPVGELVQRVKAKRRPQPIECEYCQGSGFEIVYSSFQITGSTHKCGPPVTKEQYEADPINYRMFAARCRCRPVPQPQELPQPKRRALRAGYAVKAFSLCLISILQV